MGFWSCYFLIALFLFYSGSIRFELWPNLVLFALVAWPLQMRVLRIARLCIAVPAAIALLYRQSHFPPFTRLLESSRNLAAFSWDYLLELVVRLINPAILGGTAVVVLLWLLLAHRLRMSTIALIGMLTTPLVPLAQALLHPPTVVAGTAAEPVQTLTRETLTARLNTFFASEANRRVVFPGTVSGPAFDIVVLHLCSLAWDDMKLVGMTDDRLIQRLNVLMTEFNTAASYSGPAAIRVLRGACGQPRHAALYDPPQPECQVFRQLERLGFAIHWEMNHNGVFGDFRGDVARNLGVAATIQLDPAAQVTQRAFDGLPILSDFDVLAHWWEKRLRMPAERVALFYNGASLHDGNRIEGYRPRDVNDSYARRLRSLLDDLNRFFDLVAQSGRRVVIVFIPEHGAALRGDRRQMSGLREIPTWAITHVPAGLALLGGSDAPAPQQIVDQPMSYLGLFELLSRLLADNPYASGGRLGPQLAGLPTTEPVAENEGTVVMRVGNRFQMRTPDGSWTPLD
ncbi:cellulose synthase operon protein YhjU [Fontimonas thermophila]|uniref:Cellulose synthase operon protein YhjU n=1 Tax=Fontimonas thermophila TaxID=1076937 RepID=A0A1I2JJY0_9GAMM|nr:cellulose biosynthesis protein BcsG [Fontimonas thermophila]SFF53126.1 cellulose synthase operon protein YhjU [Fontimonas thermophila]